MTPVPRASSRGDLRPEQRSELVGGFAWLAACRDPSDSDELVFFGAEHERAHAWSLHGPGIMAGWHVPFRRPRCWWLYDSGLGAEPGSVAEQARMLHELGRLTDEEVAGYDEYMRPDRLAGEGDGEPWRA
jgi:hypothetical protein